MTIAFPNHRIEHTTPRQEGNHHHPDKHVKGYEYRGHESLRSSDPAPRPLLGQGQRDRKASFTIPPPYRALSPRGTTTQDRGDHQRLRQGALDGADAGSASSPMLPSPRHSYPDITSPLSPVFNMQSPHRHSVAGTGAYEKSRGKDLFSTSPSLPRLPQSRAASGSTYGHQPPHMTRHESFAYPSHPSSQSNLRPLQTPRADDTAASSSTGQPPRPLPLRSAHSAYTPRVPYSPGPGSNGERDEAESYTPSATRPRDAERVDADELTTKGRKRKRLAKACSACHKNKRRCDGFAPCSNCEFSSRPCLYLNAQGEPIPPPRTRDTSGAPNPASSAGAAAPSTVGSKAMSLSGSTHGQDVRMEDLDRADQHARSQHHVAQQHSQSTPTPREEHSSRLDRDSERSPDTGKVEVVDRRQELLDLVDRDCTLNSELIDIFFRTCAPFNAMFHPPTFHHRLYLGKTSTILLDAMYAYAARSCSSPSLLACYAPEHPSWLRGEAFAERAHAQAERIIAARERGDQTDAEHDDWVETEEIQAFALLSIYFACLRQPTLALFYLDLAIALLRSTSAAGSTPDGTERTDATRRPRATLAEARNRTFWLVALHDLCAAANGRPRRLLNTDMEGVPLPGEETWWVRFGGGHGDTPEHGSPVSKVQRDGLVIGTGNWPGEAGQVGEIGHVLRILAIFSDIMTIANGGGAGSSAVRATPLHQHQEALKTWAMNLPSHLRFDEHNLALAIARLQSPLHHVALGGWAFGYMHAVAECGMFYLQAAVAQQPGSVWTAQRQSQAVENIAVVLDALGEKGREGPLMIFPIAVVSNWQDHIRSTAPNPTPSAQSTLLDERLNLWWAEAKAQWGMERVQVLERGFYPGAQGPVVPSTRTASASTNGYTESDRRERLDAPTRFAATRESGRERHSESGLSAYTVPNHRRKWSDEASASQVDVDRRYSDQLPLSHRDREDTLPVPLAGPAFLAGRGGSGNQHGLKHLLDPTPIPLPLPGPAANGENNRLGLYSAPASPTTPSAVDLDRPKHSATIESYLYPTSRTPQVPAATDTVSTTKTSLQLPTPFSHRPNLPPLPTLPVDGPGGRPRAISSTVPYTVARSPSPRMTIYPVSAKESSLSFSTTHRYLPSLSYSESSRGRELLDEDIRLPSLADLSREREGKLDVVPRTILSGRHDPFSPLVGNANANSKPFTRTWVTEMDVYPKRRDAATAVPRADEKPGHGHEPLLGIAALVSAAESEREREEEERRSSSGSAGTVTGRHVAEKAAGGGGFGGGDVDMIDRERGDIGVGAGDGSESSRDKDGPLEQARGQGAILI